MIDFAKTLPVASSDDDGGSSDAPPRTLTHRAPWENGNHEDGYLVGLDSVISIMGDGLSAGLYGRASGAANGNGGGAADGGGASGGDEVTGI